MNMQNSKITNLQTHLKSYVTNKINNPFYLFPVWFFNELWSIKPAFS